MYVIAREGEPFEELYRRFKRGMEASGILREYRRKQRFKPAHEERREQNRSAARQERRGPAGCCGRPRRVWGGGPCGGRGGAGVFMGWWGASGGRGAGA